MTLVSIEELRLSNRSTNALKRAGISYIDQLMSLEKEDLYNISSMGAKSVDEVETIIRKLQNGEIVVLEDSVPGKRLLFHHAEEIQESLNENDLLVAWAHDRKDLVPETVVYTKDGQDQDDLHINELGLSNRSFNGMAKNGFFHLSDICNMTMKELLNVKYLGKKSIDELIEKIRLYTSIAEVADKFEAPQCLQVVMDRFDGPEYAGELKVIRTHVKRMLSAEEAESYINIFENNPEEHIRKILQLIMEDNYFSEMFQTHVINKVATKESVSIQEAEEVFPGEFADYASDILQLLIEKKKIVYLEGKYELRHMSFREYIYTLENGREKEFLERKAQGETLDQIGGDFGISRERVRQVISKQFKKAPRLQEDKFTWLFEKYDLDQEKVVYFFNFDEYAYEYYCIITRKSGQENYLGILSEDVPLYVKNNIERYRYKDCLDVGGEKIPKDRGSILQYILRTRCRDEVTEEQVKGYYEAFLMEYDLANDDTYKYPERYFEAKLSGMKDILWKYGKKLRYFPMEEETFHELLEDIHFYDLQDVEISAEYFFINYADIMEQYDIRDAYELHNLLKKHMQNQDIDFNRMPNIGIGNYNRDEQVLNLLIQYAPIHYEELAALYEQQYGVLARTALANCFGCISEYLHNGVYSIDYEELTALERDVLMSLLNEEMHEVETLKKAYREKIPDGDVAKLNTYNFKKLGYKLSANLIYKADYKYVDTFFKEYVLSRDIIDFSEQEWLLRNQVLYMLLWQMKGDFDYIEFAKLKYISIRKLKEQGIGKEDLIDFCSSACEFMNGRQFTVYSLKKNGFDHSLFDLGFDDYFYISVLKYFKGCSYVRVGNRENALFHEAEKADVRELLQNIVFQNGSIDIYDLLDYLNDEYGITTEKYKLMSWVREADLYYSDTMEKIYLDYDQFFEEV